MNKRKGGKFLIILTSDHGEGLGNHNYDSHGKYLYNEQIKVPLVFWSNTKLIPQKREDINTTENYEIDSSQSGSTTYIIEPRKSYSTKNGAKVRKSQ